MCPLFLLLQLIKHSMTQEYQPSVMTWVWKERGACAGCFTIGDMRLSTLARSFTHAGTAAVVLPPAVAS